MNPCKHYIGYRHDNPCALGIPTHPCLGECPAPNPCLGECPAPNPCPHFARFTKEELAQQEAEFRAASQNTTTARAAIVAHLSATQAPRGTSGSIPCPVCTTTPPGTLKFSRSGYNGHIHAACSNPDCVRWIE